MKTHLLISAAFLAISVNANSQDTSQPLASKPANSTVSAKNQTVVLTPVITFNEHPYNHNMHIAADSSHYYAINGGNSASGQVNEFDLAGNLIQTDTILIDGRGLSYNKNDGYLYASLYGGDVVRIDDLQAGTFTTLFPMAMQNAQASFAISADGTKFYDFFQGTLRIHDFVTGAVINTLYGMLYGSGNFGGEAAVAVDSNYIYTWNSAIKTVYVYDTLGAFIQSFTISDGDNGHSLSFTNGLLFVSKDGNYNIGTWYGYDLSILTGIHSADYNPESAISVSPNPADEYAEISFQFSEADEIFLTDILGKTVFTKKILSPDSYFRIPTSGFSNGIYFLSVQSGNEKVTKKVLVNH